MPANGGVLAMPKRYVVLVMTKKFFKIKRIVNQVLANNEGGVLTLKIYLTFNGCDPTSNLYLSNFRCIYRLFFVEYINFKTAKAFFEEYFN